MTIQPTFDAARLRSHAVRCHIKLEKALDDQQQELQHTLKELRNYKRQQETWTTVLTKIIHEQSSKEMRMEVNMGYEQLKIQQSDDGRGQDCVQYEVFNTLNMLLCYYICLFSAHFADNF